jgi:NAD(P)-dependent dehydrogenase (short-subunit alcohol dehydrogenase family)
MSSRRDFLQGATVATILTAPAIESRGADSSHDQRHSAVHGAVACPNVPTPMKEVEGKVAFITGGSSGIGLGIARAFADAGMKVAIGYRTKSHLDEAMQYLRGAEGRIHAIDVDVTDRPGMEAAAAETVRKFGKVHVLVNNAGVAVIKPVSLITYEEWDSLIGINLTGVFNGIHAFLPLIQAHGDGGQIITTSSVMGLFTANGHGLYSASKFAVIGLMEALRLELLESNIGVSAFCPGNVWANLRAPPTDRANAQSGESSRKAEEAEALFRTKNPDGAMDELEAGRLLLRGMRNNDLYILTHPEFTAMIRERHEAIEASKPVDARVPELRAKTVAVVYKNPIYAIARDHSRCFKLQAKAG